MTLTNESFFELLASQDIGIDNIDSYIDGLSSAKLDEFLGNCNEATVACMPEDVPVDSMVTNSALSGGYVPCSDIQCRIDNADRMARFATLYAERTLIPNPFSAYEDASHFLIRKHISNDVRVLLHLRPLIIEGIVSFSGRPHFCLECLRETFGDHRFLHNEMSEVVKGLSETYIDTFEATVEKAGDAWMVRLAGSEDILPHGAMNLVIPKPTKEQRRIFKKAKDTYKLSPEECRESGLVEWIIGSRVSDIYTQSWYSLKTGCHFLTDSTLDARIANLGAAKKYLFDNEILSQGFFHELPVLQDVRLEQLVQLRKDAYDSFELYRLKMRQAVKDLDLTHTEDLKGYFQDTVHPEVRRIDKVVSEYKRKHRRKAVRDLTLGVAGVTIGLLSGILPLAITSRVLKKSSDPDRQAGMNWVE